VNVANGIAKIDPTTGLVVGSWATPAIGYDIALDDRGGVWFLTAGTGEIERLDPSSGEITDAGSVTGTPIFIAPADSHVWVGTYEGHPVRFDIEQL
jgi:streptogramin lyase